MERKWRKILYEDQGVPDNYVDVSFLDEMRKNLYTRTYDFWTVVIKSGAVTVQISNVCIFVVLFVFMEEDRVTPQALCAFSTILTLIGYILNKVLNKKLHTENARTMYDDMKTVILFVGASYGLSPVLMTLTRTTSTDTIYAMTFFMFLANLLFHDYGASAVMVSQSVSLNAAIFASVCLASRLPTTWHAFTTVSCAFEIFALGPVLCKNLKIALPRSQPIITVFLGLLALVALATVTKVGAVLFVLFHLFVTFVCPAWLVILQPYKNNIYGPWDEAVIKD